MVGRLANLRHAFWKLGVSSRGISGRISKNRYRNFSKDSCPPKSPPKKCRLPDPDVCEPPSNQSAGRTKGQAEVFPCRPDCRKGQPNLPPRGCLPWEKGTELCPEGQSSRELRSISCEHLCEPSIGQGLIDKFKKSVCEYRRFEKCLKEGNEPEKCVNLEPTVGPSPKIYPMMHALQKKYLAGCPITSHHFVEPKKDPEC